MSRVIILFAGHFLAVALMAASQFSASAQERVALVVGNGAYAHATKLPNPVNDAADIAAALRELGFEVIAAIDADKTAFDGTLRDFARRLRGARTALFYYAGHGLQVAGKNYAVPVDAKLEAAADLPVETVDIDQVLSVMQADENRVNLVFLDACRDNPLTRGFARALPATRSASVGTGLSAVNAGRGTLIAYATAPNQVALDGARTRNSPFTAALLRHIGTPGLDIALVMRRVTADVEAASGGAQSPWVHASLTTDVVLKQRDGSSSVPAFAAVAPPTQPGVPPAAQPAVGVYSPSRAAVPLMPGEERNLKPKDTFKECPTCPEMVVVPAGSFAMGSPESEKERDKDEGPQHQVTMAGLFAVGKFSITFDEWDFCVAEGGCAVYVPSDEGWGRGRQPVINVNWHDAKNYVAWLSRKTGKTYRLLTEAEREYVARAGTTTPFWLGAKISTNEANYDGRYRYRSGTGVYRVRTVPVDSFQPNPWGLYQVHGNVFDWTEDCWNPSYAGAPLDGSAWLKGDCNRRVVRGGSFLNSSRNSPSYPRDLRSALRDGKDARSRESYYSFRVARTLAQ